MTCISSFVVRRWRERLLKEWETSNILRDPDPITSGLCVFVMFVFNHGIFESPGTTCSADVAFNDIKDYFHLLDIKVRGKLEQLSIRQIGCSRSVSFEFSPVRDSISRLVSFTFWFLTPSNSYVVVLLSSFYELSRSEVRQRRRKERLVLFRIKERDLCTAQSSPTSRRPTFY